MTTLYLLHDELISRIYPQYSAQTIIKIYQRFKRRRKKSNMVEFNIDISVTCKPVRHLFASKAAIPLIALSALQKTNMRKLVEKLFFALH